MEPLWVCSVCGHVAFNRAPETCPVCQSPREKFAQNNEVIQPAAKEGKEKHVPVIVSQKKCGLVPDVCQDVHIKVGSTPHPMTPEHWIMWIDVYLNKKHVARYMMQPESLQAAVGVHLKSEVSGELLVIERCNVHGYWMAKQTI